EEVVAAFAAGGVLQRPFPLPELRAEPFPAEQAISFHLIDYVVHSWDVARTLGLEVGFDDDVLAAAETAAADVPTGPARPAPGRRASRWGRTTRSSPPRRRWRPTCRPVLPGWRRAPRSAPRSRMTAARGWTGWWPAWGGPPPGWADGSARPGQGRAGSGCR